jgi:hypothetical protein
MRRREGPLNISPKRRRGRAAFERQGHYDEGRWHIGWTYRGVCANQGAGSRNNGATQQRSDAATERRSNGATQQRSDAATERRSNGATQRMEQPTKRNRSKQQRQASTAGGKPKHPPAVPTEDLSQVRPRSVNTRMARSRAGPEGVPELHLLLDHPGEPPNTLADTVRLREAVGQPHMPSPATIGIEPGARDEGDTLGDGARQDRLGAESR